MTNAVNPHETSMGVGMRCSHEKDEKDMGGVSCVTDFHRTYVLGMDNRLK